VFVKSFTRTASIAVSIAAAALAAAGCGSDAPTISQDPAIHPGGVPRAAPSNAYKEIPTKFGRAVQMKAGTTFMLVTPTEFEGSLLTHDAGEQASVKIKFSNIGANAWSGDVTPLAQLLAELTEGSKKRDVLLQPSGACGSSGGSPPKLTVQPKSTEMLCLRFEVPKNASLELFKFGFDPQNFKRVNPNPGNRYGVWALPGTLTEACRFAPGTVKGKCEGLEAGEKK
jgi:hypothetical protein